MTSYRVPFNRPYFGDEERFYALQALASEHVSGNGPFAGRCQEMLQNQLGAVKVFLTPSCTQALEMTSLLLSIAEGDEVIMPSFTFVSTANAFALRGARPVFCDIRDDTLNIDETRIEPLITSRTRAIVAVHYAGVSCEMDFILALAKRYGLPVVEDNAHGLFAKYKQRYLGTLGTFGAQSFHETKNFSCGEGGALIINDPQFVERAELIHEKGTNRKRFFQGLLDKYSWVDIGSGYLPSEITAGILLAQLEKEKDIQEKRRTIWNYYLRELGDWATSNGVRTPYVPHECEQAFHMFYLLAPSQDFRDRLIQHLRKLGILSVFHYVPLHTSPMGMSFGSPFRSLPVTESLSTLIIRLPFFTGLNVRDLEFVVSSVKKF